jgi:hypothetical protein
MIRIKSAQPNRKLRPIDTPRKRFPRNSEIECSACPSGLLTHIVHPCTPSHLASCCQLAPPAPSPLAHELTLRRRCTSPSQLASAAAAAAAVLASPIPRRPRECRRRRHRSRGCINPTTEQTSATATYHAARYVHYSLSCLPSPPYCPRETSCHFFLFVPTPVGN